MDSGTLLKRFGTAGSAERHDLTTTYGRKIYRTLPQNQFGDFFLEYCEKLNEKLTDGVDDVHPDELDENTERAICNIAQFTPEKIPYAVDLNLKFHGEVESPYDEFFIQKVVKAVQTSLLQSYNVDDERRYALSCIVLDWPDPAVFNDKRPGFGEGRLFKIRLHFPYLKVPAVSASRIIRGITNEICHSNAISNLTTTPYQWENGVKVVGTNFIPLFGSSVKPNYPMLRFYGAYDDLTEHSFEIDDLVERSDVEDMFQIVDHSMAQLGHLKATAFDHLDGEAKLPVILSHQFSSEEFIFRDMDVTPSFDISDELPRDFGRNLSAQLDEKSPLELAVSLLPMLSRQRYADPMDWFTIGRAIHNSCNGSEEGLDIWTNETEKVLTVMSDLPSFFYDEHGNQLDIYEFCAEEYRAFDNDGMTTIKTLAWFAQEDSPESYKKWHNVWAMPYRERALDLTDHSIAMALKCDIWLRFCCSSISRNTYYEFREHRWTKIDGGYAIRNFISQEFCRSFEELRINLAVQALNSNDMNFKNQSEETIKLLSAIVSRLRMASKKSNIMREITDLIFVEKFEEYLDSAKNLTGHPNGVSEASYENATIKFRAGRPEDYVSRTTGAYFPKNMTTDHPQYQELKAYLRKFQTEKPTRQMLKNFFCGSGFIAGNLDKKLVTPSGDKNNSKSSFTGLVHKAWGSYSIKFPTTGLTKGYSDSGSANPAWARLGGPRWAWTDEPNGKERFQNGPTKLLTGNDPFYARGLFKDGGDIDPTATIVMVCNRVPPFNNADDAVQERFYIMPCASTWVPANEAPEDPDQQIHDRLFPLEKNFINRVRKLGPALLYMGHRRFPKWARDGIEDIPPEVQAATDAYWQENDIYLMYSSDRIEATPNDDAYVSVVDMYNDFEVWFNKYNRGHEVPDRATFRYQMSSRFGCKPTDNAWWGIQLSAQEGGQTAGMTVNSKPQSVKISKDFAKRFNVSQPEQTTLKTAT